MLTKKNEIMKIETKLDVGQEVYFIENNKVCTDFVEEITITCFNDSTQEELYNLVSDNYQKLDTEIFATKQDLLYSL